MSLESQQAFDRRVAARDQRIEREKEIPNPIGEGTVSLSENERTLPYIRDNPRLHDLFFGKYLHARNPALAVQIILAMEKDPLTPENIWTDEQNEFLEATRQDFNRLMAHVSLAREAISDQEIERMAQHDPRIQQIYGQTRNWQEAGRVLRSQLDAMAVENQNGFEQLINNLRAARSIGGSERSENALANVRATLARHGISEEAFRATTDAAAGTGALTEAMRDNLAQLAHQQMGWFSRAWNHVRGGRPLGRRVQQIESAFIAEDALVAERDTYMREVGNLLRGTLHPDMRIAIQEALRTGGTPEQRDERTVKTLPEYRTVRERAKLEHTPEARSNRFKEKLSAEAMRLKKRPRDFSPAEQAEFDNSFISGEERVHQSNKATGLFAALLQLLFPSRAAMEQETSGWWSDVRSTT